MTQWSEYYNSFNFVAFYNFLVDYFEEFHSDPSETSRYSSLLVELVCFHLPALLLIICYLIPSFSQVFPQHVTSTTDSTESYDLHAAQQDESYD